MVDASRQNTTIDELERGVERAESFARERNYIAAARIYGDLLKGRLKNLDGCPWIAADLVVMERFSDLTVLLGEADAAGYLLTAMADLCRRAGNIYSADYASLKHIHIDLAFGNLAGAQSHLNALEPSIGHVETLVFRDKELFEWEQGIQWANTGAPDRAVIFSSLYLAMSRLLAALGQYHSSEAAVTRGLTHTSSTGGLLAVRTRIPLLLVQALARTQRGELSSAESVLQELSEIVSVESDPGFFLQKLELEAKIAMLCGDLGAALKQTNEVLRVTEELGLPHAQCRALVNQAQIQTILNQTALARQTLQSASELAAIIGDAKLSEYIRMLDALAKSRSGANYMETGPLASVFQTWMSAAKTTPANEETVSLLDDVSDADYLSWFEQRALRFHGALAQFDLNNAKAELDRIQKTFGESDSELIRVRLKMLCGILLYYDGNELAASRQIEASLVELRNLGLKPELWQAQRFLLWCQKRMGSAKGECDRLTRHNAELLESMAQSLPPTQAAVYLLNKWTEEEEVLAIRGIELLALQDSWPRQSLIRRWIGISSLYCKVAEMEYALSTRRGLPNEDRGQASSPRRSAFVFLWEWLGIGRNELRLSYCAFPDWLLCLARSRTRVSVRALPLSRIALRQTVRTWHEAVLSTGLSRKLALIQASQQIGRRLEIDKILSRFPATTQRLAIQPDDALNGLPFAAMDCGGGFLCKKVAISIRGTARKPALRWRARPRNGRVCVASKALDGYPELPNVYAEANDVQTAMKNIGFATEPTIMDVSRAELVRALESTSIVHIACHGTFQPDQPQQTGLILNGASGEAEVLSLRDIASTQFDRLHHITLSACWSADNYVLPGRWVVSFPEMLVRAGVKSVLASLWEVDDRVGRVFMSRFYELLSEFPRDEALRRAQMELSDGKLAIDGIVDGTDPSNWAGFCLYGESGPLRGRSTTRQGKIA